MEGSIGEMILEERTLPEDIRQEVLDIGYLLKGVSKERFEAMVEREGFYAEFFRKAGVLRRRKPITSFMYFWHSPTAEGMEAGQETPEGETPIVIAVKAEPYIANLSLVEPSEGHLNKGYRHQVIELSGKIDPRNIDVMLPCSEDSFTHVLLEYLRRDGVKVLDQPELDERYGKILDRVRKEMLDPIGK
jgi:hypothetical protein